MPRHRRHGVDKTGGFAYTQCVRIRLRIECKRTMMHGGWHGWCSGGDYGSNTSPHT